MEVDAGGAPLNAGATVLVTGATSQLGRLVVAAALRHGSAVKALCRVPSSSGVAALREEAAAALAEGRLALLPGDLREPDLGLSAADLASLEDVTEAIHLGRPRADEVAPPGALVDGLAALTTAVRRVRKGGLRRLVVLSTTDASGDYVGRFYEDWLEVGQSYSRPADRAALELERAARSAAATLPIVVARHALLVGHSATGRIECDAGLSRLLALGPAIGRLPSWLPLPGAAEGPRYLTVSPIDYVAEALVLLALTERLSPEGPAPTFCLADPTPPTLSELSDLLLDRVGGPEPAFRLPVDGRGALGRALSRAVRAAAFLDRRGTSAAAALAHQLRRVEYDTWNAVSALEPLGLTCPRLPTYFDALYGGYLARHAERR